VIEKEIIEREIVEYVVENTIFVEIKND